MLGMIRRSRASIAAARKRSAWGWPSSGSWLKNAASTSGREHLELDLERPFLVAPVDRQDAVGRDVRDRLGVIEVVAVFQPLPFGDLGLGGGDLARLPDDPADRVADGRQLADRLGQDVADPFEDLLDRVDPFLGVEELRAAAARSVRVSSRFQIRNASGSRPSSRASDALVFFLGLNGR